MIIVGIDPGIAGAICFFSDGKVIDVIDMPTMAEGKKNKKQVNGRQIYNEIMLIKNKFKNKKMSVIVEALTDNKNRTASNIRTIFSKNNGSLGTQGSASHNFQRLGVIKIDKNEIEQDKIFELAIESGANDCISRDEFHEVHTDIDEIYEVKKKFEKVIVNFLSTEIEWLPINKVSLKGEENQNMVKFLETLDDEDDVQNVYTNVNFEG